MTAEQIEIATAFGNLKHLPGTFAKRFCFRMYEIAMETPDKAITGLQEKWLYRMLYRFRKQLPRTYTKYSTHEHCRDHKKN